MHISRVDAIEALYRIINSGIFSEELERSLRDIAYNIEAEEKGYHLWGADSEETGTLFCLRREDLWTDELLEMAQAIAEKYSFSQSPFERDTLQEEE